MSIGEWEWRKTEEEERRGEQRKGGQKGGPQTKFFARALRTRRKIGSGHFHCENWGKFIYGGQ